MGLSPDEAGRALVRMEQDMVLPRSLGVPREISGEWLFQKCREMGLDHASCVFPLCRESDDLGRGVLEKLIGRPISQWRPTPSRQPPLRVVEGGGSGKVAGATAGFSPDLLVVSVVPNPKQPGSATYQRFRYWVEGDTLAQCMARGLTRADVSWDTERRFVVLGTVEEYQKRRELTGG